MKRGCSCRHSGYRRKRSAPRPLERLDHPGVDALRREGAGARYDIVSLPQDAPRCIAFLHDPYRATSRAPGTISVLARPALCEPYRSRCAV